MKKHWIKKLSGYLPEFPGGHREYVRYIILGNPRTGSNFLRGLLNANRHVVAFGELFRFNHIIGWDYPGHRHDDKRELRLINRAPVRFLEKKVFIDFPSHVMAVGFKLFYFHAHSGNWESVWSYLKEQQDIKVIHIKRKNTLKTYLSHTRALKTDRWINTSGKREEQPSISLEYEACLRYFEKVKQNEKKYDDFFKDHDKIRLIFEDLEDGYANQLKRVTDFLGVPYQEAKPVTFQQSNKSLKESIVNYEQLRRQFNNSPWQEYFD
jgi:LPS sulfotransferase NodH